MTGTLSWDRPVMISRGDTVMAEGQAEQSKQLGQVTVPSWWSVLEHHSRLLVAAIDIASHRI
jgi:hypothetical protein